VMGNICFLLNSFIRCSACENIVFGWVMHRQEIVDEILSRLETQDCAVHLVSLVCTPQALRSRLQADIDAGVRSADVLPRSLERLPLYDALQTVKIDVSDLTPEQAAQRLLQLF